MEVRFLLERIEVGTVHMCFCSVCGYRPFINSPLSLGNLLDITLCSTLFRCRFLFFVIFRVRFRVSYRVRVKG